MGELKLLNPRRGEAADILLEYIQKHAKNGQLVASLSQLHEATGLKTVTIARALRKLEAQHIIRSLPRKHAQDPTTIQLLSEIEGVDFAKARDYVLGLRRQIELAEGFIVSLQEKIALLEEELDKTRRQAAFLNDLEIVNIQDLPNGMKAIFARQRGEGETG